MNTIDAINIMIAIKMTMRWKFKDEKNELEPWSEFILMIKYTLWIYYFLFIL